MLLTRLEPHEAIGAWRGIWHLLEPLVMQDPERSAAQVREAIWANHMQVWALHGFAGHGIIVTGLCDDEEGRKSLWLYYAAGKASRGSMGIVREAVSLLSEAAAGADCQTVRLGGRIGWLRVFKGLDVISNDGSHVELRKVLS
jgi:hypothetical protein